MTTKIRTNYVANEKSQNVQDVFLNHVRKSKTPVTVFLVNGVKLQGIITWFDNFSVLLRRDGHTQLVYKHAISTVMPGAPILLFDASKAEGGGRASGFAVDADAPQRGLRSCRRLIGTAPTATSSDTAPPPRPGRPSSCPGINPRAAPTGRDRRTPRAPRHGLPRRSGLPPRSAWSWSIQAILPLRCASPRPCSARARWRRRRATLAAMRSRSRWWTPRSPRCSSAIWKPPGTARSSTAPG